MPLFTTLVPIPPTSNDLFSDRLLLLLCHKILGACMVATPGAEAQRRGEQTRLADSNGGDRSGIVTFRTHRRRRAGENLWVGERDAGRREVQGGKPSALG